MTTTRSVTTPARGAGLRALRGNCMGAAVLLVIQFGLGTAVNLYVTLPAHKSFWSTVFSQGMVAVHAIVALLLVGASVSALIRSVRAGAARWWRDLGRCSPSSSPRPAAWRSTR